MSATNNSGLQKDGRRYLDEAADGFWLEEVLGGVHPSLHGAEAENVVACTVPPQAPFLRVNRCCSMPLHCLHTALFDVAEPFVATVHGVRHWWSVGDIGELSTIDARIKNLDSFSPDVAIMISLANSSSRAECIDYIDEAHRSAKDTTTNSDGKNVVPVTNGSWVGTTRKALTNVIAIGIGDGFLGPLFVHTALQTYAKLGVWGHVSGVDLQLEWAEAEAFITRDGNGRKKPRTRG
ncbi:phosphoglucose isomerase, partial [Tanacetum coccineum]